MEAFDSNWADGMENMKKLQWETEDLSNLNLRRFLEGVWLLMGGTIKTDMSYYKTGILLRTLAMLQLRTDTSTTPSPLLVDSTSLKTPSRATEFYYKVCVFESISLFAVPWNHLKVLKNLHLKLKHSLSLSSCSANGNLNWRKHSLWLSVEWSCFVSGKQMANAPTGAACLCVSVS